MSSVYQDMKRYFTFLVILFLNSSILLALVLPIALKSFQASPEKEGIRLEWKINSESEVIAYEIYRKSENGSQFYKLSDITPNGSGTYQYLDDDLYKNSSVASITYKLMVKSSNQSYEYFTSILYQPTAVQRTWGSIKAMFK